MSRAGLPGRVANELGEWICLVAVGHGVAVYRVVYRKLNTMDFAVRERFAVNAGAAEQHAPDRLKIFDLQLVVDRADNMRVPGGIEGPSVEHGFGDDQFIEVLDGPRIEDALADVLFGWTLAVAIDTQTIDARYA